MFKNILKKCWPIIFSVIVFYSFFLLTQYSRDANYTFKTESNGNEFALVVVDGENSINSKVIITDDKYININDKQYSFIVYPLGGQFYLVNIYEDQVYLGETLIQTDRRIVKFGNTFGNVVRGGGGGGGSEIALSNGSDVDLFDLRENLNEKDLAFMQNSDLICSALSVYLRNLEFNAAFQIYVVFFIVFYVIGYCAYIKPSYVLAVFNSLNKILQNIPFASNVKLIGIIILIVSALSIFILAI